MLRALRLLQPSQLLQGAARSYSASRPSAKPSSKELIRLYDQQDRPIGVKLKTEAEEFARKSKLTLVERTVRSQAKYPEWALRSPLDELVEDEAKLEPGSSTSKSGGHTQQATQQPLTKKPTAGGAQTELKRLTLSSSISDHDFDYRFAKICSLLRRNVELRLLITGRPNGKEQLEAVYQKFVAQLAGQARLTQKRFNNNNLKFTISATAQLQAAKLPTADKEVPAEEPVEPEAGLDSEEIEQMVNELLKKKS